MIKLVACFAVSAALLSACTHPPAEAPNEPTGVLSANADEFSQIEVGEAIAAERCVSCHAIGLGDTSPNPSAPALASVAATYSVDALFDDFRTGSHVGGEEMPAFDFTVQETDAVIAYLDHLYDQTLDCGSC